MKEPYPNRGIIPRETNPYKGNKFKKSISPKDWKLLEMSSLRKIIRGELKKVKEENPKSWKKLCEIAMSSGTVSSGVEGYQEPKMKEYGINELIGLYEKINNYVINDITKAAGYASKLSEQLLDEDNFEMRNAHGLHAMKRNAKYLGKLSEELEKVNDALSTGRMQALALIDEIGMIAHRYHGKK